MTAEEVKNALLDFISDEIDVDEITNIEHQCGGCWIDLSNGKTISLTLMESENE
jgi:hypothetical protein